jgi:hypothetical protein
MCTRVHKDFMRYVENMTHNINPTRHHGPHEIYWGTTGPLMKSRMIEISYETHQEIPWGITGPLMKSRMIEISYETHQ